MERGYSRVASGFAIRVVRRWPGGRRRRRRVCVPYSGTCDTYRDHSPEKYYPKQDRTRCTQTHLQVVFSLRDPVSIHTEFAKAHRKFIWKHPAGRSVPSTSTCVAANDLPGFAAIGSASRVLSAGANVKAVRRMFGHATAAMTLDLYGHLPDDDLSGVAEAFSEAVKCTAVPLRYSVPGSRRAGAYIRS
jgi:integrase